MVAAFNAPDHESKVEAAFLSYPEAQAYADAYGGSVEARGVAFVVGPDADHGKAKDDIAALQAEEARKLGPTSPAAPTGLTNAEIEAIVERRLAAKLAETPNAEPEA